jgi:hypothetical protein
MKKGAFIMIVIWSVLLTMPMIYSQDSYTKDYEKKFKVNESSLVQLANKYGDMHIENWAENSVSIKVKITVNTSNKSKAESTFDKISIDFKEDGNMVSANTSITESINNTNFSVDYDVKMPKNINVDLSNKYGNLFVDQIDGQANISVKYGNFTINKLGRENEKPTNFISVGYSSGFCNINDCGWLKLESAYSKVNIENATALIIGSKYSSLKIRKCKSIVTESKYDHPFKVGIVKNFVCTGAYSNFEINKLYSMLETDLKYSDLDIDEVDKDFESVKIVLRYGKVNMQIPTSPGYDLNAEAAYGSINYPDSKKINKIIDHTESKIWGIVGEQAKPKATVTIDSKYGTVNIE